MQTERGDLLSKGDVVAEMSALIRQVRSRLLALPTRIGNALGLERVVIDAIDAEIRAILAEMADVSTYSAYFEMPDDVGGKPQRAGAAKARGQRQ